MNHDELRDSIPALALDALPEKEQLLVEAHVAGCAGCSLEYRQYLEVASLLVHLAPPAAPPPGLWDRIKEGMTETVPRPAPALSPLPAPATGPNGTRGPRPRGELPSAGRLPHPPRGGSARWRSRLARQHIAALAAAALLVAGGFGVWLLNQPGGHGGRGDLFSVVASGPHTVVPMHPTAQAPGAGGEIFVAPDGKVAVSMHGLRPPGSGTYTMWLIAGGEARRLGDFRPDASGNATMATPLTTGHSPNLVVTLEDKAGNVSPTGPPIIKA